MTSLPPPARRGPRLERKLDEETMIRMADDAKTALARAEELAQQAEAERAKAAKICAELNEGGLSVKAIATTLEVTPAKAQRLIEQGRSD